ncbi:transporter associated domain-containing protein [Tessaracoccus coleopterorum]|uniref:transporter associated domain-containing protein n=1 Tax=Tessaracoccus coleopterorum TaxID=2714950 RepID=UPI0018D42DE0
MRVGTVRDSMTIAQVREMMATGHTRYPVIAENNDVLGVVHLIDVLDQHTDLWRPVTTIARDSLFLPTFMSLPDAQEVLRDAGEELACVLDEFGAFVGIVTVEDLVEEIVGDLVDEHDLDTNPFDDIHVVRGDMPLDDLEQLIGHRLPEGDYETLSGLLIHEVGDLPAAGDVITLRLEPTLGERTLHEDLPATIVAFEVQEIERHVPSRVRIEIAPEDGEAEA